LIQVTLKLDLTSLKTADILYNAKITATPTTRRNVTPSLLPPDVPTGVGVADPIPVPFDVTVAFAGIAKVELHSPSYEFPRAKFGPVWFAKANLINVSPRGR
jgi:hypothetical protein